MCVRVVCAGVGLSVHLSNAQLDKTLGKVKWQRVLGQQTADVLAFVYLSFRKCRVCRCSFFGGGIRVV